MHTLNNSLKLNWLCINVGSVGIFKLLFFIIAHLPANIETFQPNPNNGNLKLLFIKNLSIRDFLLQKRELFGVTRRKRLEP